MSRSSLLSREVVEVRTVGEPLAVEHIVTLPSLAGATLSAWPRRMGEQRLRGAFRDWKEHFAIARLAAMADRVALRRWRAAEHQMFEFRTGGVLRSH